MILLQVSRCKSNQVNSKCLQVLSLFCNCEKVASVTDESKDTKEAHLDIGPEVTPKTQNTEVASMPTTTVNHKSGSGSQQETLPVDQTDDAACTVEIKPNTSSPSGKEAKPSPSPRPSEYQHINGMITVATTAAIAAATTTAILDHDRKQKNSEVQSALYQGRCLPFKAGDSNNEVLLPREDREYTSHFRSSHSKDWPENCKQIVVIEEVPMERDQIKEVINQLHNLGATGKNPMLKPLHQAEDAKQNIKQSKKHNQPAFSDSVGTKLSQNDNVGEAVCEPLVEDTIQVEEQKAYDNSHKEHLTNHGKAQVAALVVPSEHGPGALPLPQSLQAAIRDTLQTLVTRNMHPECVGNEIFHTEECQVAAQRCAF